MSELLAIALGALPGIAAVSVAGVRWRRRIDPVCGWRHASGLWRLLLVALAALALAACHTTHRGHFATTPVPLALVPFNEPLRYTIGPNAGQPVPAQNGLLASYFAGALYDRVDHQQIDPNIDFDWNAENQNPVVSGPESLDTNEGIGSFIGLPATWGIWSIAWEGYLDVPADGRYGLRLHVNNGGWLEMKDASGGLVTVLSCPGGPGFEGDCDAALTLAQGKQYLRVSYYQNGPPSANAHLSWQKPGDPGFSIIPNGSLFTQVVTPSANTVPVVSLNCPAKVFVHDGATVTGSFIDPDAGQTWTATYDGFNQAGPAPLALSVDHTFSLLVRAPTLSAGTFHVVVVVTDSAGASGRADCTIVAVPKRVMFYVHGTTGRFDQTRIRNDFPSLIGRLIGHYGEVRFYEYYEDRANQVGGGDTTCLPGKQRVIPSISVAAGMPLDPPTPEPAPGICDSNDDIELNAVVLDADVQALARDFDKVSLLSNSGGTRIVRAYLAYAAAASTGSLQLVDMVVSLEGAQAGSYLTLVYDGLDTAVDSNPDLVSIRDRLLDKIRQTVGHDPTRPVFEDVRPRSPIIRYTNVGVAVPNEPHYLNVDGDVRIHVIQSFFLIPFQTDFFPVGDVVFLPGEDDPTALPERGGARFLPSLVGRGQSSTEWELSRDFDVNVDPTTPGAVAFLLQIAAILDAAEVHTNFGAKLDAICVRTDRVQHLDEVLFDEISALDSGVAPAPGRLGLGHRSEVRCP